MSKEYAALHHRAGSSDPGYLEGGVNRRFERILDGVADRVRKRLILLLFSVAFSRESMLRWRNRIGANRLSPVGLAVGARSAAGYSTK